MIRKIAIEQLAPGMYVVDLHKPWLEHNLWRWRFPIHDLDLVHRLAAEGITEVSIDTERGADVAFSSGNSGLASYRPLASGRRVKPTPPSAPVSVGEERRRATPLLREAKEGVQQLIDSAHAGRKVETGRLEPLVGKMVESVLRNPDALVPLARVKRAEAYASDHAVASTALAIALARHRGLDEREIEQLALGNLVKDIGHSAFDNRGFAKARHLSGAERDLMRSHVEESLALLEATASLPEAAVAVVLEHHERFDGSGYPYGTAGESISRAGHMAAIADAYDAMTSDRPYRGALSPVAALRQIYEHGGLSFDPEMVASFVRTVGIYPVGSLVRLESGHLAVVEELHRDNLLTPVVRVIYHAGRRQFVTPVRIDLARRHGNHYGKIVKAEDFEIWGLHPLSWQPA